MVQYIAGNIIFILLIYATALERILPFFGYWDELITILLPAVLIYKARERRDLVPFLEKLAPHLIPIVVFLIIGLMGNLFHFGYQSSFVAIIKDILAVAKFPIVVYFLRYGLKYIPMKKGFRQIGKTARILVLITSVAALIGYFIDLGLYTGEIRILNCFKFIFPHPTYLVSSYVFLLGVLFADSIEKNKPYIFLDCLILFMGQRTKGYVVILLALGFLFIKKDWITEFFLNENGRIKLSKKQIAIITAVIGGLLFLIAGGKVMDTVKYGMTAARPALYIVGFKLLMECFPFGAGFGTFGSYLSGEYYSGVYHEYGISGIWGLTPDTYNYMADTYWPYIYGQFGIFGCILYIRILWDILFYQFRRIKDYNKMTAFILVWAYVLFTTTAEAYFTGGTGIQMAVFMTVYFGMEKQKE